MTVGFRFRTILLLVLPLASLFYLVWSLLLVARVPVETQWKAAADVVRAAHQQGDCVVFNPPWAGEGAPLLEGLDVRISETVDWYEARKCTRVWVLSSLARSEPDSPAGFRKVSEVLGSGVDVRLYRPQPRGELLFDFLARIDKAQVSRIYPDRMQRCKNFRDQRWYCGGEHRWQFVGRHARDIAGVARNIIWAHPLDKGARLEIRYPDVPMGRTLVVHYGLTQRAIETGEGAPTTFWIDVGEERVFERTVGVNEGGWFEETVDVSGFAAGADVVFTVFTRDYKDRQFCFDADMWG